MLLPRKRRASLLLTYYTTSTTRMNVSTASQMSINSSLTVPNKHKTSISSISLEIHSSKPNRIDANPLKNNKLSKLSPSSSRNHRQMATLDYTPNLWPTSNINNNIRNTTSTTLALITPVRGTGRHIALRGTKCDQLASTGSSI